MALLKIDQTSGFLGSTIKRDAYEFNYFATYHKIELKSSETFTFLLPIISYSILLTKKCLKLIKCHTHNTWPNDVLSPIVCQVEKQNSLTNFLIPCWTIYLQRWVSNEIFPSIMLYALTFLHGNSYAIINQCIDKDEERPALTQGLQGYT